MYIPKSLNWTILVLSIYEATETRHLLLLDKNNDKLDYIYNHPSFTCLPELTQRPQFSNPTFIGVKNMESDGFNRSIVMDSCYHKEHETERKEHVHNEIVYPNSMLKPESGFSSSIVHHVHMHAKVTVLATMQKKISKALYAAVRISDGIKRIFRKP